MNKGGYDRASLFLFYFLLLSFARQGPSGTEALRCWECLEESCNKDSSYQNHAKRECPTNFVCQKTIFQFFYKFKGKPPPRKDWRLHRSVVRGCSSRCQHIDERPYCDAYSPNLTHPDQDMHGCMQRYCCTEDLCNAAPPTTRPTMTALVALIPVFCLFGFPFLLQ